MTVINTNVSATLASNAIVRNERAMNTAMERLATGTRINSASDDAAGLAIASKMTSQVKGLEQASRNANDAISLVQTVEGAGKEILNILTRMKELSVQATSGTYSATDRDAMDLEFQQLKSEITRIETNTTWNGQVLMDGSDTVSAQVGAGSGQTMSMTFGNWSLGVDTTTNATTVVYGDTNGAANNVANAAGNANMANIDLQDATRAATANSALDIAISGASAEVAKYGAYINRLEYASDNLLNVAQNTDASRSRIEDADYAEETSELAKTQIIAQAGTAMLAQANQIKQTVLALLQ
ncbi:MAG: flagellin [Gammaproteobacteria bacterium]|nr:flagellin [Gammaproteobacteria bacterium]MDG2337516.1 flagellin [Gammaproteobacteria bacterium]